MATKTKPKSKPAEPVALPPSVEVLLDVRQVMTAIKVGRRKFYSMLSDGEFPRADIRIGDMGRWRIVTLNGWIARQAEANQKE